MKVGEKKKCFNELMLRSKSMWRLAGGSCAYNFRCDFFKSVFNLNDMETQKWGGMGQYIHLKQWARMV